MAARGAVMPATRTWIKSLTAQPAAAFFAVLAALPMAHAATITTLYDFCAEPNCTDGAQPESALIQDRAGNLYGTTVEGGASNLGTVFELSPKRAKTQWTETVLYSFSCIGCGAGAGPPSGGVVIDPSGTLYGSTLDGGIFEGGSVYTLSFDRTTKKWVEKTLFSFCGPTPCSDGSGPVGDLVISPAGTLYGATVAGGNNDRGTVFELVPDQSKSKWTHAVLYKFCQKLKPKQQICLDGADPLGGLVRDPEGRLYGTTLHGGLHDLGIVYEVDIVSGSNANLSVLHSFCAKPGCAGFSPVGGLVMSANGRQLFGTATAGGASLSSAEGTVFALTRSRSLPWPTRTIYSFCALGSCADGSVPYSLPRLAIGKSGNLYGTTTAGGTGLNGESGNGGGVAFELTRGARLPWHQTVLYSFCQQGGTACGDGEEPMAGLIATASHRKLYGVTRFGGAHGGGKVFEISP